MSQETQTEQKIPVTQKQQQALLIMKTLAKEVASEIDVFWTEEEAREVAKATNKNVFEVTMDWTEYGRIKVNIVWKDKYDGLTYEIFYEDEEGNFHIRRAKNYGVYQEIPEGCEARSSMVFYADTLPEALAKLKEILRQVYEAREKVRAKVRAFEEEIQKNTYYFVI